MKAREIPLKKNFIPFANLIQLQKSFQKGDVLTNRKLTVCHELKKRDPNCNSQVFVWAVEQKKLKTAQNSCTFSDELV